MILEFHFKNCENLYTELTSLGVQQPPCRQMLPGLLAPCSRLVSRYQASSGSNLTPLLLRSPTTLEEVGAGAANGVHGGHGPLLPSMGSGSTPFTGSASVYSEDLYVMPGCAVPPQTSHTAE